MSTIASLFFATTVVGLPPLEVTDAVHADLKAVLNGPLSTARKLKAISHLVIVGDKAEQIETRLGAPTDFEGHGPGFFEYTYQASGLIIAFYPDGTSYGIGYRDSEGMVQRLKWPPSVSWPRSPLLAVIGASPARKFHQLRAN